ncbi:Oxidoreductase [Fusarium keratoplasticum]|uniref:Oxidoreductase n=1 Tax=Fusarium keratoplasticum TaxID=1328300 RepID=A0ACC0RAR2_9HYPO|nr:Oxidoreductase [Fusarium keratoplasticum]KAI8680526.1 Oxidoreductase [Fusarium keratoplasticum]
MSTNLKTVVVLGGSYVGLATTKALASVLPATHRILLVEPHSHFHHLFAFPRFAVLPSHEHKAFIPYSNIFAGSKNPESHAVVKARATAVLANQLFLDREWQNSREIPFDYLVIATGTKRPAPFDMPSDDKPNAINYLQAYQKRVAEAQSILIVGGGANGVQIAADIKELYPEKDVILAHSRQQLMPGFHQDLDALIKKRFKELGVSLILGCRVATTSTNTGTSGNSPMLRTEHGKTLVPDLIIPAVGQVPNTEFLDGLTVEPGTLINPANGFLRVKPTLQLDAAQYANIYAVGDVADTGARKAARPGVAQAECVAKNIVSAINGNEPNDKITVTPPGIHLTLGLKQSVIFRNPNPSEGRLEPVITMKDDGLDDMGIDRVWIRRGIEVKDPEEYFL